MHSVLLVGHIAQRSSLIEAACSLLFPFGRTLPYIPHMATFKSGVCLWVNLALSCMTLQCCWAHALCLNTTLPTYCTKYHFASMPQGTLVSYIGKLRLATAHFTDERVRLIGEAIAGCMAVKMMGALLSLAYVHVRINTPFGSALLQDSLTEVPKYANSPCSKMAES